MNRKPAPLSLDALAPAMLDAIRYYGSDLALYPIGCPPPPSQVRAALIAGGLLAHTLDLTPAGVAIFATIKSGGMSAARIEQSLSAVQGHAYAVRAAMVTDARGTCPVWTVEPSDPSSPDNAWHAIERARETLIHDGFDVVRIGLRLDVLSHVAPYPVDPSSLLPHVHTATADAYGIEHCSTCGDGLDDAGAVASTPGASGQGLFVATHTNGANGSRTVGLTAEQASAFYADDHGRDGGPSLEAAFAGIGRTLLDA